MEIIDDQGRIFGTVNIIDAMVVLLVLAVVIAGAVFIMSEPPEAGERYVTIDLGQQSDAVINQIEEGDLVTYDGSGDNLTITDTYVYEDDGESAIMVRALASGSVVFDETRDRELFEFRGEPLRIGEVLEVDTPEYTAEGEVLKVDMSGESLETSTSELLIETTLDASTVNELAVGDQFNVGEHTLAEVVTFEAYPINATDYTGFIGLELSTINLQGDLRYGHQRLAVGSTIQFSTDAYGLAGEVINRGDASVVTEAVPLVLEATVPTSTAAEIEVGDTYEVADRPLITVEDVTVYPTGDPTMKRVFLGVETLLRQDDGLLRFGTTEIRTGDAIPIRTEGYDLVGEVIQRGTMDRPGEPGTVTATVELQNVPPTIADRLTPGLIERYQDRQTAEVLEVTSGPAAVILESEDGDIHLREHPRNKDLEIELALEVRQTADGETYFRGDPLRTGEEITLELGQLTPVEAVVLDIE